MTDDGGSVERTKNPSAEAGHRRTIGYVLPVAFLSSAAARHYVWTLLLVLGFSFPIGGLFEAAGLRISAFVMPAIITLPAIGLYCLYDLTIAKRSALSWTCGAMVAVNITAFFLIAENSSLTKITMFWATLIMFGMLPAFVIWNDKVLPVFGEVLVCLGAFTLALLALDPGHMPSGRITFGTSNPIWVARLIGLLALGSFALIVQHRKNLPLGFVGIMASLCGVMITSSRAPLLALLFALGFGALVMNYRENTKNWAIGVVTAMLALACAMHWNLLGSSRLLNFTGTDKSTSLRVDLYHYNLSALAHFSNGMGVGNFHFKSLTYPHNIFLEFVLEWGWTVGMLFNGFILSGSIALLRSGPEYNALKLLLIYELVNAGFSGDITSPRFLYALMIIGNAMIVAKWRRRPGRIVKLTDRCRPTSARSENCT